MKFGICCDPGFLASPAAEKPLSSFPRLMETLLGAGADFLEFSVGAVMPAGEESEFDALRDALKSYPIKPEAFNCFLPARHRITGPEVELASVLSYCHTALLRCKAVGGAVVVLGSGGARRVPEGFGYEVAERQFVKFCRELAPIAEEVGIDIAIEPLNAHEDNLILSVEHGASLVDEISHPRIRLLADLYHMMEEGEPLQHIEEAGCRLRHAHVADYGRVAPGFAEGGEAPLLEFFAGLRAANDADDSCERCSFEGRITDLAAEAKPAIDLMRRRWLQAHKVPA